MHCRLLTLILIFVCFTCQHSWAQSPVQITGKVSSPDGKPLEMINVALKDYPNGTITDVSGHFSLKASVKYPFLMVFSSVGFEPNYLTITSPAQLLQPIDVVMHPKTEVIADVLVKADLLHDKSMTRIDPRLTNRVPDAAGGGVEGLVKTQMGVASNNELSSQYRVRGGNYDENLVYVNDIEIYRPFLIRSGQQEGLSFANPDMVSSMLFSPGGFNASYGDKMSSVLDIRYKRPTSTAGSFRANLLGVSGHIEGASKNQKFSYITGVRFKTNQYLLGSLDTKGDYSPRFFDVQTLLSYQFNDHWQLDALGYFSQNDYEFVPTNRETSFGTISDIRKLTIYFEGQEHDRFQTGFGALSLNHRKGANDYRLTLSGFRTYEEETYDILGEYWLQELDPVSGEPVSSKAPITGIGVGGFLQHARNELLGRVSNVALKGTHKLASHQLSWEAKVQSERFDDYLNEWDRIDSAGYSMPYTGKQVNLAYVYNANLDVASFRTTFYVMDAFSAKWNEADWTINYGVRANYWNYNDELLLSPRINVSYRPKWENETQFRAAYGIYYQSPFYKELRTPQGELNSDIKAQKSTQWVIGADRYFMAWGRPFKFTSEAYYKKFDNLITYQVDNVRIRYSGVNDANGYAVGIDFKVDGEFVEGVESWLSLGLMQTMEDVWGDAYEKKLDDGSTVMVEPGYIARPSDQRVNFSLFFQDYLPNNPSFKVHLNLIYGTGLPFGPPDSPRYKAVFRSPAYRRTDIGFSKDLLYRRANRSNTFKKCWVGLEIFNIFDVSNTISYYWVTDVNSRQYAVPNYLTSRRLSVNLVLEF
jgi:hypothetical protein